MRARTEGVSRSLLLASAAMIVTAAAPAAAQDAVPAAPAPVQTAAADTVDDGEIIVTAQRRAERLQDVPLSITAVSGQDLRDKDITDATRLEQIVPGLRLGRSGPATRPAIRGVYTEAVGVNSDPRIGFYIDEIYQSRPQQGSAAFIDLERAEVQKGPQGTLFGRNSLGGNIALITATPKDTVSGALDLTGGNYNRFKLEGYYNQPIADGLSARVAVGYERHDGYLKSTVSKDADLEDEDYYFVRGSIRWAPPSLDGRLEVLLHASYFHESDNGYNNINAKVLGALVDPTLIRTPGQSLTVNGITYTFPNGYNGGNYATGRLYPFTTALRDNIPDVGGADIGIPVPGKYKNIYDFRAYQRLRSQNYSATVNYDVTDWLRFRSITGYADFKTLNVGDGDGGPIPVSYYYTATTAKTFTQEFQLQSKDSTSPLQYTFGAFYLNDKDRDGGATVYLRGYTTAGAAAQGLPVLYASGSACGFTYLPNTASCAFGLSNSLNAPDGFGPEAATTKSYAGYGQVSYTFADKLTFTGGVRYTSDRKTFAGIAQTSDFVGTYVANQNAAAILAGRPAPFPNATGLGGTGYHATFPLGQINPTGFNTACGGFTPGPFALPGSTAIVGTVPDYFATRCGKATFNFFTYRAAVDYKLTPENLLYASFSTGKHSGGFGGSFVPTTNPSGEFGSYGAEGVQAFEVGSKNRFLDGKLQVNVAAFYNRYTNVQIQGLQFIPAVGTLGTTITTIYNGPTEKAPGVEAEIIVKPWRGLTINVAGNYLHARYNVYGQPVYYSGLCSVATTGAGTPCNGFSSAPGSTYPATLGGLGSGFFPNALTDPSLFEPIRNNAGTIIGYQSLIYGKKTKVQNTPDVSINFGAEYEFDLGGSGRVTAAFNTLFSGSYLLSASTPLFEQHSYFKTDLRVAWVSADDHFSAQVFVNNVTNYASIGRVTTASLAASGTYADPRTFGVKVGYRF